MEDAMASLKSKRLTRFDAIACCALIHAASMNPEVLRTLQDIVTHRLARTYCDVLVRSRFLAFLATDDMKIFYHMLASAEKTRMEDGPALLKCAHTCNEHREALLSVIAQTPIVRH